MAHHTHLLQIPVWRCNQYVPPCRHSSGTLDISQHTHTRADPGTFRTNCPDLIFGRNLRATPSGRSRACLHLAGTCILHMLSDHVHTHSWVSFTFTLGRPKKEQQEAHFFCGPLGEMRQTTKCQHSPCPCAAHIVVRTDQECRDIREKLMAVHHELRDSTFRELAKHHSMCHTGKTGGILGSACNPDFPEKFTHEVLQLGPGEISACFSTSRGHHIAKISPCQSTRSYRGASV